MAPCNGLSGRTHVRTGAADDPPLHWPCDAAEIRALAWSDVARRLAERLGVTERTVVRWRRRLEGR